MLTTEHMMMAVVLLPIIALIVERLGGASLAERHHLHHDTYSVSPVVSRTMILVMIFMGVLGALVGWLSHLGVFAAKASVPLSFFLAFQATMLVVVIVLSLYQVMLFEDRMVVTRPFLGERTIPYQSIVGMRRVRATSNSLPNDLIIIVNGGSTERVLGLLDIEQILLRIDRFDVMMS